MQKKIYEYSETLPLKGSTVKLNSFTASINHNVRRPVLGVVIREHDENKKDKLGTALIPSDVANSGYISINDFSENVLRDTPISVIIQMTKEKGYYPVNIPGGVDFNQSVVVFGDTTNGLNKSFVIGFRYS